MAYQSNEIRETEIQNTNVDSLENVKVECKLIRDKDLEENQIEINASVYDNAHVFQTPKPLATSKIKVDYAEILAKYDHEKQTFDQSLLDDIFFALNSELAPKGYQLIREIQKTISGVLMHYIPFKMKDLVYTTGGKK